VKAAYDKWKAAYVAADCGGHVVKVNNGTNLTGSSALGTGMIITAMMAGHDGEAQATFDGMFTVARKFPSYLGVNPPAKYGAPRKGNDALLAYTVLAGCKTVDQGDSSVNGDLDFAYALVVADRQWGSAGKVNYLEEAKKTIAAIKLYDMSTLKTPLIGDWASLPGEGMWTTVTKPPHFAVGYFRAFGKATGEAYWMEVADAVSNLIAESQTKYSPSAGLFPQYLMGSKNLPGGDKVLPDDRNARDYFDDAALIPLFLAADYIGSGDARAKTALTKINTWLKTKTGGDAGMIVDGYRLDGTAIGNKGTMAYVAPFATTAIFDAANQAWVDSLWKAMTAAPATNQVADTANLLGMLVMSGNWWQP
jgi:endo-1,4-beta-D-glucanase Y